MDVTSGTKAVHRSRIRTCISPRGSLRRLGLKHGDAYRARFLPPSVVEVESGGRLELQQQPFREVTWVLISFSRFRRPVLAGETSLGLSTTGLGLPVLLASTPQRTATLMLIRHSRPRCSRCLERCRRGLLRRARDHA